MKIGIDIDGVLADIHTPLLKWHNEKFGTNVTIENSTNYNMGEQFGCTLEEAFRRVKEFFKTEEADKMIPIEGSIETITQLSKKNTLYTVTSRMPEIWEHTHKWLDKYFPNVFTERIFCDNHDDKILYRNKGELCRQRGIDILIDDCLQYANDCSDNNVKGLLFDFEGKYGWTKGEQKKLVTKVYSWKDVERHINKLS